MADENRLDVLIRTEAELAELRESIHELKEFDKVAEAANRSAAEGAKTAAKGTRDFKLVVQQLSREFPLLGAVGRMALNPIVAAATALSFGFHYAKVQVAEFMEQIEQTPMEAFGKHTADVAKNLREVRDAAKEATAASERQADVMRAQLSAEERLDDASRRMELAEADGMGDPVARARRVAGIEQKYAGRALDRERRERTARMENQQGRFATLSAQDAAYSIAIERLQGRRDGLGSEADLEREVKLYGEWGKGAREDRIKQEEIRDAPTKVPWYLRGGVGAVPWMFDRWRKGQAGRQAEGLSGLAEGYERLGGESARRLAEAQRLSGQIGVLEQERTGVRQSMEGIRAMLPTQAAVERIGYGAAAGAFEIGTRERALKARNEAGEEAGKLLEALLRAIEGNKAVDAQVLKELDGWRDWKRQMEGRIANLRAR